MAFQRADGVFGLWFGGRKVKRCRVGGVEPPARVSVEQPVSQTLRVAKLRFESPPVDAPIHNLCGIVLPSWGDDPQAYAEKNFLLPVGELLDRHGGTTQQVHRQAGTKIQ